MTMMGQTSTFVAGQHSFTAAPGALFFILGPNGTGKSALVQVIKTQLPNAIYVPGSRPSYFDNQALSLSAEALRTLSANLLNWDNSPDTRWRSVSGTQRNERAIFNLQAAEVQYKVDAANRIAANDDRDKVIADLAGKSSPLDKVNQLLKTAALPVRLTLVEAELRAQRGDSTYSIAKMSDGERSAVILAAEIVTGPEYGVFIIDEPELHLHPSISTPLLRGMMAERPSAAFIISTHELMLPEQFTNATFILVRACTWLNEAAYSWDCDVLVGGQLPESIRTDVLGARRKILFVEGEEASLDQPMYALLFPEVSVRAKGGAENVKRSVLGLRSTLSGHHLEAFGLIDNDGMDHTRIASLESEHIFPMQCWSVESLYYSSEVIACLAAAQANTMGLNTEHLVSHASSAGLAEFAKSETEVQLVSRRAEMKLRDGVSFPNRQQLPSSAVDLTLAVTNPYPAELNAYRLHLAAKAMDMLVARYPIRESGVPNAIAKSLRFRDCSDYERAALVQVASSDALADQLRNKLGAARAYLS